MQARSEPRGGLAKLLSGPVGIAAAATLLTVMMAAPVFVEELRESPLHSLALSELSIVSGVPCGN